jgi:hypothetical protein
MISDATPQPSASETACVVTNDAVQHTESVPRFAPQRIVGSPWIIQL